MMKTRNRSLRDHRSGAGPTTTSRAVAVALFSVGVLLGLSGCVPPPLALHSVDQSNVAPDSRYTEYVDGFTCAGAPVLAEASQTFTAGRTGLLDQVSLNASRSSTSSPPLEVTIQQVRNDGAPDGVSLGTASYSGPGTPPFATGVFVDIPLSRPAWVFAGRSYALVVDVPPVSDCRGGSDGWHLYGTYDLYAGGQAFTRGNYSNEPDWIPVPGGPVDLYFKTWVRGR